MRDAFKMYFENGIFFKLISQNILDFGSSLIMLMLKTKLTNKSLNENEQDGTFLRHFEN